ncbi:MAG: hypothetical protein LBF44_00070 [Holosporaceae bacterium]|nr:hypothetical protein [Holosporaceae bacterium]
MAETKHQEDKVMHHSGGAVTTNDSIKITNDTDEYYKRIKSTKDHAEFL